MTHMPLKCELQILFPTTEFELSEDLPESVKNIVELTACGKYFECLKQCTSKIPCLQFKSSLDMHSLSTALSQHLSDCKESDDKFQREVEVLCCAVSCLQLFVLNNWTGPTKHDLTTIFPSIDLKKMNDEILSLLEMDGESTYPLVTSPILLYIAMATLSARDFLKSIKTASWWYMRYTSIHQQLLAERSPTLHTQSSEAMENLLHDDFLSCEEYRSYAIQLDLEAGLLQLFYYQYKEAENQFEKATATAGIQCSLDGALGVRTRFQQKPVAQLRVKISKTKKDVLQTTPAITQEDLLQALPLNDDMILDTVKFNEENEDGNPALSAEEQAIVLTMCTNMQKTSPSNKLRDEEILCILDFLLSNPKSWAIHTETLRVRSALQRFKSRTVERSMMQLESLVNNIRPKQAVDDDHETSVKRLSLFYSVWPKPEWMLQKQLAQLFESLGVLSSALDIYKRLHMWEEAIICLIRRERGHEAELIIREQLAIKETANLYCLLGDVLQDPSVYEKAWEVSNHHNSRAMRSLAAYKVSKKLYKEAIECFEKSLKVNYLQVGVWFLMGCASLASEEYEKAAKSFQKCVSFNWDNFEAWTNLSTAFVRCNKKPNAFRALQEAIKCNYDSWQLWENFLFIAMDVGQFNDVIRAYNRLLDLKDKYLDIPVLNILVRAINEDMMDAHEQPASRLKPKVQELFGRLTSKTTSNWEVWSLYARLIGNGKIEGQVDVNEKALNYLQKALRSGLQQPSWEKDQKSGEKMTEICEDLIEACLHFHEQKNKKETTKSILTSAKLSVNSVVAKLKMQGKQVITEESKQQYDQLASKVEEKLTVLNLELVES